MDVLYWELEALMLLPLSVGLKWDYYLIQLFLADVRNELTQCEGLKMLTEVYVYPVFVVTLGTNMVTVMLSTHRKYVKVEPHKFGVH